MRKYTVITTVLVVSVIASVVASRTGTNPTMAVPRRMAHVSVSPTAQSHFVAPHPEIASTGDSPPSTAPQATEGGLGSSGLGSFQLPKAAIFEAISQAAITYSADQLQVIGPYLNHPDPDVRSAAVDGILLLGDAAGARLLREAALKLTNASEITRLQEKANYLELPSLPRSLVIKKFKQAKPPLADRSPASAAK